MLGKLIKHEFKATARYFIPLFLAVIIMTPITRFFGYADLFKGYFKIIPRFFILIYAVSILALTIVSCVILIIRFYKNLFLSEGYLMHTLPATPAQHIICKTLTSFVWTIASAIIMALSLFAQFVTHDRLQLLKTSWENSRPQIDKACNGHLGLYICIFTILMLLGIIYNILFVYASIAIGQVISRHKVLGAVAAAMVVYTVTQVLSCIIFVPLIFTTGINPNNSAAVWGVMLPSSFIFTLGLTVVFFFVTNYIMKKKLNLD